MKRVTRSTRSAAEKSPRDENKNSSDDVEEGFVPPKSKTRPTKAAAEIKPPTTSKTRAVRKAPAEPPAAVKLPQQRRKVLKQDNHADSENEEMKSDDSESSDETGVTELPVIKKKPNPPVKEARIPLSRVKVSKSNGSTKNQSMDQTSSSSASSTQRSTNASVKAKFDTKSKKEIWEFLVNLLQEMQTKTSAERKRAYKLFQIKYYKETRPDVVNDHQKYFAQSLWRICVLPFQTVSSQQNDRILKFVYHVFSTCGTEEDRAQSKFELETYPMFIYILKLFNQSHMDDRQLVRLRVTEAVNQILLKPENRNHPTFISHPSLGNDVMASLQIRLRDKYAPARVLSATVLKYFTADKEIIKDLKYYSRFDPHADVRAAAISSLGDLPSTKTSALYEQAFDPADNVRIQAFTALAQKPPVSLNLEKRIKLLYWGLTQEPKVKKCVTEKFLVGWFEQYDRDPIKFLKGLNIVDNTKVTHAVLNTIYPNNYTATFEAIDRSFLDEDKKIPLESMTLEAVVFWIFLIKKFGGEKYHHDRLLPNADIMGPYIREMIRKIHIEHENAEKENRDEDVTLCMCLGHILSITMHIGLEEGNRRHLEEILRDILLDPLLDEAQLVISVVEIMRKIVTQPKAYAEKMMSIFQIVFEPNEPAGNMNTPRSTKNSTLRPNSAKSNNENGAEPMEVDNVISESENEENQSPEMSLDPQPLTENELVELKERVCTMTMQRLRLAEEKAKAVKQSNFLEAHRIQELLESIMKEEKDIRDKIKTPQTSLASLNISAQSGASCNSRSKTSSNGITNGSSVNGQTPLGSASQQSNHSENEDIMESEGTIIGESPPAISEQNMLKGLVMLTRYLSISPKLTPLVQELYKSHIISCLTEEDSRVRVFTLQLLTMIGLIESGEKRKIMALLLRALAADPDAEVKSAAYKGTVDLLLEYKPVEFKCQNDTIFQADLPKIYNDPEASADQLEELFIVALDEYADGKYFVTPEAIGEKVLGMIKLLQATRISSPSVVAEIFCMWADKRYSGSSVPFHIGMWLPLFTKSSVANAKLVAKALLISIQRILEAQDNPENDLCGADFAKVVDFVVPYTSPEYLDSPEGKAIHEELAQTILEAILQTPKSSGNLGLMKVISKLQILTSDVGRKMCDTINTIILKISNFPQTVTISALKQALRASIKRITKKFEDLADLANVPQIVIEDADSDVDSRQHGIFSDDDDGPTVMSFGNEPNEPNSQLKQSQKSSVPDIEEESDSD